ncbi:MAG: ABC transporter permease [Lachnospiraceae bacterium]|nr:ABC transporter permease [Lachnospiraceae bacterium]
MKRKIIITAIFALFILFLLFAPRKNILKTDVLHTFEGSSAEHWMGTDNLGRDVWSLLVAGGVRTLEVVFLSMAISFFAGTALGMIAAFWGGIIRSVIQFLADFTLVVPSFIMAMVFSALFGFSPLTAGVIFGVGNMGEYVNQSFDLAYGLKKQEFIDAEKVVGLGKIPILIFHVVPNIYRQLLVFLGNKAGNVTVQYAGLAFIGLGTDITNPDWGTLLYQYRAYLTSYPMLVIYPAAAIAILTILFHLMFDSRSGAEEAVTLFD